MRSIKKFAILICLGISNLIYSQSNADSLGLPGDNFDLYGALDAFKKAETPEALEKALNAKDNDINNLDLDGDGNVDYVKVIDKKEKDGHTLILQVAVSKTETQDVAVIEIEKTETDKAHVQIVGDEELYGKDYIVEPKNETASNTEKKQGVEDDVYSTSDNSNRTTTNNANSDYSNSGSNTTVVVNVWAWPSVQYMYAPSYVVWNSPWYWGYYPTWWSPWGPTYWHYHHRRAFHYHHGFYHRTNFYRSPGVHSYYYGHRTTSGVVKRNRESGFYQKRQQEYKKNAVPGRKYNNLPADKNRPRTRENTPRSNPKTQEPRRNVPVRDKNTTQPQQPVKTPREPKQHIDRAPTNTPRKNAEPRVKQNVPQQRAPQQRAPQSRQGGGQKRTR
jgi:hypothetical protein